MRVVADAFKKAKNLQSVKLIYLYAIKYESAANLYLRYTNYGKPITFEGNEYTPYLIKHDSIVEDLSGQVPDITLTIANVNRYIQAIHDQYGLIEKEARIIMIAEEEISDPQAYSSDTYYVSDLVVTKQEMTLRLSSTFNAMDIRLPRRYFFRAYCRFRFKDGNCQYAGEALECNKTFQRCRELGNTYYFGAFPSIPVQRLLIE